LINLKDIVREKKRKKVGGESERHYTGGGQETISPVLKVPRQCPLVFLVILSEFCNIYIMTLEGLH
jgi:hypothetical protein